MKTNKLVEPAEINGSVSPVGGIEPVTTSYCTMIFQLKIIFFHHKYSLYLYFFYQVFQLT